jgi:hypothetical protein
MNTEKATKKRSKFAIFSVIARLFCSHDYHLVDKFEIKSEFDIVHDSGRTPNSLCSLTRKYIWDYKCSKCNNIKRFTNSTPH